MTTIASRRLGIAKKAPILSVAADIRQAIIVNRRQLIGAGLAGALCAAAPPAFSRPRINDGAIIAAAKKALARHASEVANSDLVGLVDFARPSAAPRLFLVDMVNGRVSAFLTAHGRGSDPEHTGWLATFSNEPGSKATSRGAYLTGGTYHGKYGRAMRLQGLERDNDNAEARAIVIHAAWYVSDDMIARHGKLGRSEGCFALQADAIEPVLSRLGRGRLLYADRFDGL